MRRGVCLSIENVVLSMNAVLNPMLPDFFLAKVDNFYSECLKELFSMKPSQFWSHLMEKSMFHKNLNVMNLSRAQSSLHSNQNFDLKFLNLHFKTLILSVNMNTTLRFFKTGFK